MRKIFFNRVPRYEPYGGGSHFVTAMVDYLKQKGHQVTFHLDEGIDTIFMIDPRPGDIGYSVNHILDYKSKNPHVKIFHRVNECDARKNTDFMDDLLINAASKADRVVFISKWLRDYFQTKGINAKGSSVIYNGCNLNHFYPRADRDLHSPIRLVTHHWSDNWLKGFDLYQWIDQVLLDDDRYEFTYIGRYAKEYQPTRTKIVKPLFGKELGDELRKHDIYVTASRREPCGMHHVEGAASGLPVIFHSDTGGIVELCKNHGEMFTTPSEFLNALKQIEDNIKLYQKMIDTDQLDIVKCCESYYEELVRM